MHWRLGPLTSSKVSPVRSKRQRHSARGEVCRATAMVALCCLVHGRNAHALRLIAFPSHPCAGFSVDYSLPDYQKAAVSAYLTSTKMPQGVKYGVAGHGKTATGRGTPDVSALGWNYAVVYQGLNFTVGGTSASAPFWGSVLAQLAKVRAKAGKKLGFVNPLLYAHPEAFTDVVKGTNAVKDQHGHGGDVGWSAEKGWDACTGLGTPRVDQLLAIVEQLNKREPAA